MVNKEVSVEGFNLYYVYYVKKARTNCSPRYFWEKFQGTGNLELARRIRDNLINSGKFAQIVAIELSPVLLDLNFWHGYGERKKDGKQ